MKKHHRLRLLHLLLLLMAVIGVRALEGQSLTPAQVRHAADTNRSLRVIVSIARRTVWVLDSAGDTLRVAPVAVGSGRTLRADGHVWTFRTPVGIRKVISVESDPLWMRPDWAYVELGRQQRLRLEQVRVGEPRILAGGAQLILRGATIGILRDSAFEAWPVEKDIVIGRALYVPPPGSPYRARAGVLGRYRLNLGSAIGFHGTNDEASVGKAVTHGCMRLHAEDVEWMYLNVPIGTPVFIY
jgi:hypothetical protein